MLRREASQQSHPSLQKAHKAVDKQGEAMTTLSNCAHSQAGLCSQCVSDSLLLAASPPGAGSHAGGVQRTTRVGESSKKTDSLSNDIFHLVFHFLDKDRKVSMFAESHSDTLLSVCQESQALHF